MKLISKYLALKDIVDDLNGSLPDKPSQEHSTLIEDMIFEIVNEGDVITDRVKENIIRLTRIDKRDLRVLINRFADFVKRNKIKESITETEYVSNHLTESQLETLSITDNRQVQKLKEQLSDIYSKKTKADYVTITLKLR